jgi:hypothetical protein
VLDDELTAIKDTRGYVRAQPATPVTPTSERTVGILFLIPSTVARVFWQELAA